MLSWGSITKQDAGLCFWAQSLFPTIFVTLTLFPFLRTTERHVKDGRDHKHYVRSSIFLLHRQRAILCSWLQTPLVWPCSFWVCGGTVHFDRKHMTKKLCPRCIQEDRKDYSLSSSIRGTPTMTLLPIMRPHLLKVLPPSNNSTGWWPSL